MKKISIETEIEVDLDDLILNFNSFELINHLIIRLGKNNDIFNIKETNAINLISNFEKSIEKEMWYINHNSIDPNKLILIENYKKQILDLKNEILEVKNKKNLLNYYLDNLELIKTTFIENFKLY